MENIRTQTVSARDGELQGSSDVADLGMAVRVVHGGAWGFAAGVVLTTDAAVTLAESAVRVAQVAAPMTLRPVVLADEPVHADQVWVSAYERNPLTVPLAEKAALLTGWTRALRTSPVVRHATAALMAVQDNKHYADLSGTRTTQQRIRFTPSFTAHGADDASGVFDSLSTLAPPVSRGWEYVDGTGRPGAWDFDAEIGEIPDLLAEKLAAPGVEPGAWDLVIDPTNLWLTIHESIGHATELDRALGYEANYAGTSFATPDQLGTLRYGSPVMNVTGDRTVPHGLATIGFDDDGVETGSFDIVREGTLVGYQLDRSIAHVQGLDRSNGCAYADSPGHVPIQRMANVSLQPDPEGPSTAELVGRVERGLYVVGDKSWSIDMQRYNFQFTAQRFFRIADGEVVGQVRDAAYQGTTTDFWGSLEAVGGPQTWLLHGADNCGKAQPGQVAGVSHGCPTSLFRGVTVLNTTAEGAHDA